MNLQDFEESNRFPTMKLFWVADIKLDTGVGWNKLE